MISPPKQPEQFLCLVGESAAQVCLFVLCSLAKELKGGIDFSHDSLRVRVSCVPLHASPEPWEGFCSRAEGSQLNVMFKEYEPERTLQENAKLDITEAF